MFGFIRRAIRGYLLIKAREYRAGRAYWKHYPETLGAAASNLAWAWADLFRELAKAFPK
jgi:hypothetical protein